MYIKTALRKSTKSGWKLLGYLLKISAQTLEQTEESRLFFALVWKAGLLVVCNVPRRHPSNPLRDGDVRHFKLACSLFRASVPVGRRARFHSIIISEFFRHHYTGLQTVLKHAFKLRSNVRNICNLFRGLVPFFSAINCLVVSVLSIGAHAPFKIRCYSFPVCF